MKTYAFKLIGDNTSKTITVDHTNHRTALINLIKALPIEEMEMLETIELYGAVMVSK